MKILFFTTQLYTIGGIERTLIDKANWLVDRGHEVMFVTFEQLGFPYSYSMDPSIIHEDLDFCFFRLYNFPKFRRIIELLKMKRQFRKSFKRILVSFSPDIITIATPNTEIFLPDVVSVSKKTKVVIESHLAHEFHNIHSVSLMVRMSFLFNSPMQAIRNADMMITLTGSDAARWREMNVKNVQVLYNPMPFPPINLPSNLSCSSPRIICVGRLNRQKRFDRMIDAFSLIANKFLDWKVDIYGDGDEKLNLQKQIDKLGLTNRISLKGTTEEIISEYICSQFLVLSSDYEGFGLVLIEAMACGIPVVSTNCPCGPSEIIEDGVTGLLCRMDVDDLAEKMEWMITHESERKGMGIKAHQATARYERDKVMKEWELAYMSVLA